LTSQERAHSSNEASAQRLDEDAQVAAAGLACVRFPCDGREFKQIIESSTAWLEAHIELVNSLNVYPVPDGDTGTNMYLTMQAALREVSTISENTVSAVARGLAHGALMGARGNSGVILSQIWRGISTQLDGKAHLTASGWAGSLHEGAVVAYKGVMRPVEGTILTVAREAAEAAVLAAAERDDMLYVLEQTLRQAGNALERTPSLLPVLAEAGVVDAGGQGLYFLFEGILRHARGEAATAALEASMSAQVQQPGGASAEYGYDIQFLLNGQDLPIEEIREVITGMGESVLVVGDPETIKVHVHSDDPGKILTYATSMGALSDIVLENMQQQYQDFVARQAPRQRQLPVSPPLSEIATVAVVNGEGLQQVFESLGASAIVRGGQTMNPSTEELLGAISALSMDKVILLPNNPNIILAAQQAQQMSDKQVAVVATSTIPQGVSALLAFNYQSDLKANVDLMERAASQVQTIEVTNAVRSVRINGLQVTKGQFIGLLNGELVEAGADLQEVTEAVLRKIDMSRYEIITVYWGDCVVQEQAADLATWIAKRYPDNEVELVEGRQPYYQYVISAE